MGLAFAHPAGAGLIAPTGGPVGAFRFGMGRVVTLEIAGEDLVRLAEALAERGWELLEPGLIWLLREGASHFAQDQRTWELLSPRTGPVALELQRREAAAHAFSMRARTLRAEAERDALQAQVHALSQEYERLRRRLAELQRERHALRVALGDRA